AVPPLVHFRERNPHIDLGGTGIVLPQKLEPWPDTAGRYAGVSSFGMSGTNAHVVIGAFDPPNGEEASEPAPVDGFEVSARTLPALRQLAHAYAERLRVLDPADFPAFAYTATAGRPVHPYRIVVRSSDPRSAADALTRRASEGTSPVVTPPEAEAEGMDLPPGGVSDRPRYPWQRQRYGPLDELPDHVPSPTGDDTGVDLGPLPLYHLRWESIATPAADAGTVVIAGDDD